MSFPIALRFSSSRHLTALALFGAAVAAWRWMEFARRLRIGDELTRVSAVYERSTDNASRRVLVVGDSVAAGCGAARSEDSVAGLLAQEFPDATIVNRARNGARTAEVIAQIRAEGDARYDLILLNCGANDILKRTPFALLPPAIEAVLREARQRSECVICTTTPNIGLVPMFPAPLSWWLTRRSRQLRDLFAEACERHGAHYVNFFHPRATDPFSREARRFYARDGLHPSSDCYSYAYSTLRAATPLVRVMTP